MDGPQAYEETVEAAGPLVGAEADFKLSLWSGIAGDGIDAK